MTLVKIHASKSVLVLVVHHILNQFSFITVFPLLHSSPAYDDPISGQILLNKKAYSLLARCHLDIGAFKHSPRVDLYKNWITSTCDRKEVSRRWI